MVLCIPFLLSVADWAAGFYSQQPNQRFETADTDTYRFSPCSEQREQILRVLRRLDVRHDPTDIRDAGLAIVVGQCRFENTCFYFLQDGAWKVMLVINPHQILESRTGLYIVWPAQLAIR